MIEDCAQAHGAKYEGNRVGSFGDMGCFSFYPTKNLGGIGDGGMVVTNDSKLAEKAKLLREYGWTGRRISQISGWNSRLDELQAAILRVKLRHLDEANARRVQIASLYRQRLKDCALSLPEERENASHVYHLYVVRSRRRDGLIKYLNDNGIGASIHYPVPVHLQPAYRKRLRKRGTLSVTEQAAQEIFSLPMYPELEESVIDTIAALIRRYEKENL
jgi:dTDP-4-amino-4,6-dideoxygalactose transaminase